MINVEVTRESAVLSEVGSLSFRFTDPHGKELRVSEGRGENDFHSLGLRFLAFVD